MPVPVSVNSHTQANLLFPIPFFGGLGGEDDEQEFEPEPEGAYGDIEWEISDLKGEDIWFMGKRNSVMTRGDVELGGREDMPWNEVYAEYLIKHKVTGTLFAKNSMPFSRHGTIAVDGSGKRDDAEYTTKLKSLRNTAVATFVIAEYEHQDLQGYADAFDERVEHQKRLEQAQDGLTDAQYDAANPGKLRDAIASEIIAASDERLDSAIGSIEQQHSASRTSQEAEIRQQYATDREAEIKEQIRQNYADNYQVDLNAINSQIQALRTSGSFPSYWRAAICIERDDCQGISKERAQARYDEITPKLKELEDKADDLRTAKKWDDKDIIRVVNNDSNYSLDAEDGAIDAMIEADKAMEDSEIAQAGSTEVTRLDNEIAALDARDFQAEADAVVAELEYNIGNYEGFVAEQDAIILDYENALTLCNKEFPSGVSIEVFWEPETKEGWFRKVVPDKAQYARVAASGTVSCGWLPTPEEEA